jgi:YbbR domain-containing protein
MTVHPFRNLGLKALATALAVAMWLMVSREAVVERSLRVPLEYQNIPDGIEIVGSPPSSVDVRVRGTSSLLGRVEPGDVIATLDLKAARPGERLFHIAPADVRVPMGVQVNQISPQPLSLAFERTISKVVPVVPQLPGTPAQGFAVGVVAVVPARVEVTGPESHVRDLTRVTTEPISLDGAREPLRERVALGVEDPAVRLASVRSAEVAVEIVAQAIERTFTGVVVQPMNAVPSRLPQIVPPDVTVLVRGDRDVLAELAPGAVLVYVDLAGLGRGIYTLPVKAVEADGFAVVRTEPETVSVRIR